MMKALGPTAGLAFHVEWVSRTAAAWKPTFGEVPTISSL